MAKATNAVSLGAVSMVAIVIILVAGFGGFLITGLNTSVTTSNSASLTAVGTVSASSSTSTSSSYTETSVLSSITSPCGSPRVYCGRASIVSASLTVGSNSSALSIDLAEIGNSYIGSATVYINGTVIGTPPASEYEPPGNIMLDITANQSALIQLAIPESTIPIHIGSTYAILVYAWLGTPGERASSGLPAWANVTAV